MKTGIWLAIGAGALSACGTPQTIPALRGGSHCFVVEVPADLVSSATIRGCDAASHSFMQT